jgi:F0F1-type ATP synthase assembly protein I
MATNESHSEDASPPNGNSKPLGPWLSTILGTVVGSAFLLGGYLLVVGKHDSYAVVMFLLVPFVSGFAIAAVTRDSVLVAACCMTTCIFTFAFFIVVGLEGYICCIMALPLFLSGMVIGAVIGYFVRGRFLDLSPSTQRNKTLLMLAAPVLLISANQIEKPLRSAQRVETFESSIEVSATPDETWKRLVRMPSMDGDKPFLLQIGLPVPDHCTMDGDAVGARRVCHFNQGIIAQEVTDWQFPNRMAVKTTESTLPGRHWLTFMNAEYELRKTQTGTLVVRRTSIGSKLYPRWYWRPFEAWGVESEHTFVLTSLKHAVESRE